MYVKRQELFDAIQFTGGEESAKQVIEFARERDGVFGRYVRVVNANETVEVLRLGTKEVREGDWIVFGYVWNRLDLFTTSEFERIFQPEDKPFGGREYFQTLGFDSKFFHVLGEGSLEEIQKTDIPEGAVVYPISPDLLLDKDFVQSIRVRGDEPVKLDEAVITNGVIDSVPGADYIIDQTKYNEDTLTKVRDALNASEFVKGGYSVDVINQLQNAGILFRERI